MSHLWSNRVLRHAGHVKRLRMVICMHEAAHAVAFSELCGVWACATVYSRGGGCCACGRIPEALMEQESVALAAGRYGEEFFFLANIPGGPYKRIHASRKHSTLTTDERKLTLYAEYATRYQPTKAVDLSVVHKVARTFVLQHLLKIIPLAEELFHRGTVFVPQPADGLPVAGTEQLIPLCGKRNLYVTD